MSDGIMGREELRRGLMPASNDRPNNLSLQQAI